VTAVIPQDGGTTAGVAQVEIGDEVAAASEGVDEFRRLADERDALLRIAALIAGGHDEVYRRVAAEAATLSGGRGATLIRFDGEHEYAVVGRVAGPAPDPTRTGVAPDDQRLLAKLWRTRLTTPAERRRQPDQPAPDGTIALSDGVGVPITIDGCLWGVLTVTTGVHPVAPVAERRLQQFAALVTGAIANVHARAELTSLADERAALRRIHAVAGRGGTGADVLAAIAAEASARLGGGPTVLLRLTDNGAARVVAGSGADPSPDASDRDVDDALIAEVLSSGAPARVDDYAVLTRARVAGWDEVRAAVGVPVVIAGHTWGVFMAGSTTGPMPSDAEDRLTRFTQSITPTILSAQARSQLANEQLALRRVAELVARGAGSDEVFARVVLEASVLAHDAAVTLARWDVADRVRIVAAHGSSTLPVGTQVAAHQEQVTGWIGVNDHTHVSPPPELADWLGRHGSVVVPVKLSGLVWGVLTASSASGPLPPATEQRLHQFADLVAAALANAHARTVIQALADEQAALRRVAELAARDTPATEVLAAVALEASALAGVECTILLRYEPDGSTEIVALAGGPDGVVVGDRAPADGDGAVPRVWQTGRPARVENLAAMSGHWAQVAHRYGYTTSAAVPITIQGSLWGTLVAVGRVQELLTSIEDHLRSFAELAGTAIAGAQARQDLRMLAEEQVALGRVAGLVARGVALEEVFTAVANEASALNGGIAGGLWRLETDDHFLLVANANCLVSVGFRAPPYPGTPFADLLGDGAPSQVDSFDGTPLADATRDLKIGPTVTVPVIVEGRLWGAMTTSAWNAPLPAGVEHRLQQFAELAGAAIANAENKAKLMTSRARVVATADETRRRLQRDVHDSAQQRLVHTIIALKLARQAIADGSVPEALVDEALVNAERASNELRDVVRGILPAALTRGGLRTGLESLLTDLVLPVDLTVTAPRCSAHTELTAYFVIAEALTNVVKHAQASRAEVLVTLEANTLALEVRDDGIGGADPVRGTGLLGLVDRVDAVEGTLTLTSPPGGGTALRVHLPLQPRAEGAIFPTTPT
jgi:signal transduction histidine kinase